MARLRMIGVDMTIGSRLPGMFVKLGLSSVSGELVSRVVRASDNLIRVATVNALRKPLVEKGAATDAELDRYIDMLLDPEFVGIEPPVISVWGRRSP
jgi:hypothetical protein